MHLSLTLRLFLASLVMAVNAQGQQEQPQRYLEEIEVRVVNIDVMVTDRQGNPVTGLAREDFELFEDGKRVEISNFSEIGDGRSVVEPSVVARAAPSPHADETEASRTAVTWVVFLDQSNTHPARRNQALRQLRQFFEKAMAEGDRGIVTVVDGIAFRIRQNLTGDKTLILNAITALEKERAHPGPGLLSASTLRYEMSETDARDREFEVVARSIANRISVVVEEEAARTLNAIHAMGALVDVLARIDGRMALVYVGGGFNSLPGMTLTENWRRRFVSLGDWNGAPSPELHQPRIEQELTRLLARMNATRVTMYSILTGASVMPSAEDPGLGPALEYRIGDRPDEAHISGDRSQLTESGLARELTERTGGLHFKVSPELAQRMDAVRRDLNHYYSLGYVPKGTAGQARKVRVKVSSAGARVRHRESVRERTHRAGPASTVLAALVAPRHVVISSPLKPRDPIVASINRDRENPHGISVETELPQRDGWGGNHLLPVRFRMQLEPLTFVPRGDSHRADLVFHFALAAPDGTVWPLESRQQWMEMPSGEPHADPQAWQLDLPPLRVVSQIPVRSEGMKLIVALEDRATGVRSITTTPLPKRVRK